MNEPIVILLSGGQDSTTSLFWAKHTWPVAPIYAVSMRYGQRHQVEVERARWIADIAGCAGHTVFELDVLAQLGDSALVNTTSPIEAQGGYADREAPEGLPTSFVPGRNAFFLLTAAAYAVKVGARRIVTGVCETDYSGYPDCRAAFISSMEAMLNDAMPSSCGPFLIHAPLMKLDKAATVRLALTLDGCYEALAHTVTCYEGKVPGCGACPACVLRAQGFAAAGVPDPANP